MKSTTSTTSARPRQRLTAVASLLAVAVVMLAWGAASAAADVGVGSWSATEAMPLGWSGERRGSAVTLADGSVLAVADGVNGVEAENRPTELYDPASGTWTEGPELPEGQWTPWTLVALAEGGALLLGEAPCSGEPTECLPNTAVYRWSPGEPRWSPVAPMLEARVRPVAVRLSDGRVLIAGGFGDDCPPFEGRKETYSCQSLASAEIYDPASNEWSPTAPMPQARGGAAGALLSDGTVLVVGGDDAQDGIRYEPASGTWTAAGQSASSRTGSLLFALSGDRALAMGSEPEAGFFGVLSNREYDEARERKTAPTCNTGVSSEIFATASDAWTASLTAPAGSEDEGCPRLHGALLAGGQILLETGAASPNSFYVLDAERRCWSTTAAPVEQREEGTMVALPDGRALVFGGAGTTAEIYTPSSPTCAPPAPVRLPPGPPPPFAGATIVHGKHLTVTAAGSVRLPVQCPASAASNCIGAVRLALLTAASTRARSGSHTERRPFLGRASFTIAAGRMAWVTVRITDHRRMFRALVRRRRGATIVVTAAVHDGTGQVATTTASETLRTPRGRAR